MSHILSIFDPTLLVPSRSSAKSLRCTVSLQSLDFLDCRPHRPSKYNPERRSTTARRNLLDPPGRRGYRVHNLRISIHAGDAEDVVEAGMGCAWVVDWVLEPHWGIGIHRELYSFPHSPKILKLWWV